MTDSPWIIVDALSNAIMTIPLTVSVEHPHNNGKAPSHVKPFSTYKSLSYMHASHSRPCILMFPSSHKADVFRKNHLTMLTHRHSRIAYKRHYHDNKTVICVTKHYPFIGDSDSDSEHDERIHSDYLIDDHIQPYPLVEYDNDMLFSLSITTYAIYFYIDNVVSDNTTVMLHGSLVDPFYEIDTQIIKTHPGVLIIQHLEHAYKYL
jgi:hypothetical protein